MLLVALSRCVDKMKAIEEFMEGRKKTLKEIGHLLDDKFAASVKGDWNSVSHIDLILELYGIRFWKLRTPDTAKPCQEQVAG